MIDHFKVKQIHLLYKETNFVIGFFNKILDIR